MDAFQILLVEDDPGDARLFREEPAARRCEVTAITRLGELPPMLESGRFDVLLLDRGLLTPA